jgi:hypothetical protein
VDGISLDGILGELAPHLLGRVVARPRIASAHALTLEAGGKDRRLWLDAGRRTAGLYLLTRDEARALEAPAAASDWPGRTRQALLLFRKHVDGVRVASVSRVPGERTLVLDAGRVCLVLRLSGRAPALTLAVDGAPVATVGEGPEAWPVPTAAPEREWDRVDAARLTAAVDEALVSGRGQARSVLAVCPVLGPILARELDDTPESVAALRLRLGTPRPILIAPGLPETWHDADLDAVDLVPIAVAAPGRQVVECKSWLAAAASLLGARLRHERFRRLHDARLEDARRRLRRLSQLEVHLERDLAGLADTSALRRSAEALLASSEPLAPGETTADVADPYDASARLRIAVDPGLTLAANADRLFQKARRLERARKQVETRLAQTRRQRDDAAAAEQVLVAARDLGDVAHASDSAEERGDAAAKDAGSGPRHYLTTRGLSILVGRGARENHHLTFAVARPEDVWLHARDVPGAHVIVRDPEGRAGADDLREAAELAAFFSESRAASAVDVHVTRRKHLRPQRGGPGRVFITHSDTLRVAPRDPEGRLRRR